MVQTQNVAYINGYYHLTLRKSTKNALLQIKIKYFVVHIDN